MTNLEIEGCDIDVRLGIYGGLEDDAQDATRMIVRLLGTDIGTSFGWAHLAGHCLLFPEWKPNDRAKQLFEFNFGEHEVPNDAQLGLVVDYYINKCSIVEHSPINVHPSFIRVLHEEDIATDELVTVSAT